MPMLAARCSRQSRRHWHGRGGPLALSPVDAAEGTVALYPSGPQPEGQRLKSCAGDPSQLLSADADQSPAGIKDDGVLADPDRVRRALLGVFPRVGWVAVRDRQHGGILVHQ